MTLQTITATRWPTSLAPDGWKDRLRTPATELETAWGEFLGGIEWEGLVTLTFDPKKRFPVPRDLASYEAFLFFAYLGYVSRTPVGWLYTVERTSSGLWHAHGLVVGTKGRAWVAPKAAWRERNGIIDVSTPIRDTRKVVLYTTKEDYRTGEVVLSDTLPRYRPQLAARQTVSLEPDQ